jgi:hypothetical protein
MEFLSHQFNESQGVVNLVLQTPESVIHGYDASGTKGFQVQHLPFRPDELFHESGSPGTSTLSSHFPLFTPLTCSAAGH